MADSSEFFVRNYKGLNRQEVCLGIMVIDLLAGAILKYLLMAEFWVYLVFYTVSFLALIEMITEYVKDKEIDNFCNLKIVKEEDFICMEIADEEGKLKERIYDPYIVEIQDKIIILEGTEGTSGEIFDEKLPNTEEIITFLEKNEIKEYDE